MLMEFVKTLLSAIRPQPVELTLAQRLIAIHIRSASP
jgi:hypothetical protein